MTERPIMFSSPMVKAILDGRKSQTRRVVRYDVQKCDCIEPLDGYPGEWSLWSDGDQHASILCPYGVPGELLWVREALIFGAEDGIAYEADGARIDPASVPADAKPFTRPRRPAMLMPRWASRITLEITDVRVQRLQEISDADALAEGVDRCDSNIEAVRDYLCNGSMHVDRFARLWNSINEKRAPWASNPYVWAVTFKRADR